MYTPEGLISFLIFLASTVFVLWAIGSALTRRFDK